MKRLKKDSACLRVLRALKDAACGPWKGVSGITLSRPSIGGLDWGRRLRELRSGEYNGVRYRIESERVPGKKYHRYFLKGREVRA